jgi:hypothetical protein
MPLHFGGGSYQCACPVCHADLHWPMLSRGPDERIRAVAGQHERGCPASVVDPARLRRMTRDEAMNEVSRVRGTDG